MDRHAAYIFGLTFAVFVGALVAVYATKWLAGFKPRYTRTLLSTFVAYAVAHALSFATLWLGALGDYLRGFQALGAWAALVCAHINLVRSDAGESLSAGKAILLALIQIFGTILALVPVILIIALIMRIFQ